MTPRSQRSWWHYVGVGLATVLIVGGLVVIGMIAFLWVGMASYGSNK